MGCLERLYDLQEFPNASCFELPSLIGELDLKEVCLSMSSICNTFAADLPKTASGWANARYLFMVLIFIELTRYCWHYIRLVALNFRRHTPPSTSYTLAMNFAEHAAFVEEILCDHKDLTYCIEGLFMHRRDLSTITRDMLEDAVQAHLAMEVRRWYPKKHRLAADRIIERIEDKLGCIFVRSDATRELIPTGASISHPISYDAHPEDARKPYLYIGEQRLHGYFKPLPTQCAIWMAKMLKRFLLCRWGFRWHNLGPVQVWVREPPREDDSELEPPLLFCPGLFLGNTAYLNWIHSGLLPLGKRRPIFLLELPHLSHGIDPRRIAYSLRYSWPSSDEVSDALAHFLQRWPGPADIVGNSFGTVIMTAVRRDHPHLFRKFVYIDPVCFIPCFPSTMLAVAGPLMDSYSNLFRQAWPRGCKLPTLKNLFKYLVLRPCIFGDLEVQYVMKRGLYIHECCERGTLGPESLILIGRDDELLHDPAGVGDWLAKHWPEVSIRWMNFNHGAMMGQPAPYAKLLTEHLKMETTS